MPSPKITVTKRGEDIVAQCDRCSHEVVKPDKKTAVQTMIGHLAGRHRLDLDYLLDGNINFIDKT